MLLLLAACCMMLPTVKTATSLCGKHLIVAHICAPNLVVQLELPLPPPQRLYLCLCLSLSFRWPFPFAIGKKRRRAEWSRGQACGIVNALRCLPLKQVGCGRLGWRLYLSTAITIIISNNQRVVVATATECQMLRNACNITADCCGQSASHCCGAWGNNYSN